MHICRSHARSASLLTPLVAMAIAVTAFAVPAQAASSDSGLGTKNPAKGTPVKIGFITDGKTAARQQHRDAGRRRHGEVDQRYQNGIGGHPIQLVTCEAGSEPEQERSTARAR